MELRELAEHAARKRDRMPATVVVAADREWRIAATGEQHRDRRGGDTGLVTSISTITSQRGSSASSDAAIDDEQPAP